MVNPRTAIVPPNVAFSRALQRVGCKAGLGSNGSTYEQIQSNE